MERPEAPDWNHISKEQYYSKSLGIYWAYDQEFQTYRDIQYYEIPYRVGDRVKLHSRGDYDEIPRGSEGVVTKIEDGIFEGDFYTSVTFDDGKKAIGFSWRFKKI